MSVYVLTERPCSTVLLTYSSITSKLTIRAIPWKSRMVIPFCNINMDQDFLTCLTTATSVWIRTFLRALPPPYSSLHRTRGPMTQQRFREKYSTRSNGFEKNLQPGATCGAKSNMSFEKQVSILVSSLVLLSRVSDKSSGLDIIGTWFLM